MKNILLILFILFSSISFSQGDTSVYATKAHYFPDLRYKMFTTYDVDMTITFKKVNTSKFITFVDNITYETNQYVIRGLVSMERPSSDYYVACYLSENLNDPGIEFVLSFMFYNMSKKLHSVGISNTRSITIYEIIYRTTNTL